MAAKVKLQDKFGRIVEIESGTTAYNSEQLKEMAMETYKELKQAEVGHSQDPQ